MARIAVVVGHIYSVRASAVELGRRLRVAGHEVLVVVPTGSPPVEGVASVEHDLPVAGATVEAGPHERAPLAALRTWRARRRRAVLERVDPELVAVLDAHDAELVLVDAELVTVVANVLAAGHRTALLTVFPGITRDLLRPPSSTTIVPGRGPRGSAPGIAAAWLQHDLVTGLRWAVRWLRGRGDSDRARTRRLVRHLGLPRGTTSRRHWIQPLTFPGLHVLETNLAELDLPSSPDPRRHLVGPMVLPATDVGELAPDVAALVEQVVDARAAGERIVYCSFGSFAASYDVALLQRVVDAVAPIEGARLVLALGGGADSSGELRARLRPGPDTIVFDWAPQRTLLRHADAAVVHGGQSSVHECLAAAVPMVVLPMVLDQPGYAARIVFHGIGGIGPSDPAAEPSDALTRRITRVLHSRAVRERVARMQAAQQADRDARVMERTVERLLSD